MNFFFILLMLVFMVVICSFLVCIRLMFFVSVWIWDDNFCRKVFNFWVLFFNCINFFFSGLVERSSVFSFNFLLINFFVWIFLLVRNLGIVWFILWILFFIVVNFFWSIMLSLIMFRFLVSSFWMFLCWSLSFFFSVMGWGTGFGFRFKKVRGLLWMFRKLFGYLGMWFFLVMMKYLY